MKRKEIALSERQRVCDFSFMSDEFINFCRQMSDLRVFVFLCPCTMWALSETYSPLFIELKKVDYRVCLEYHTEKILLISYRKNPAKI